MRFRAPTCYPVLNQANSARAGRKVNALWNESYDEMNAQQTSAKQSQFPHGQQWAWAGEVARTAGGTNRAKQTQSAPHRPEDAVGGRAASASFAGDRHAKQSQFPGAGHRDEYRIRHRMPAAPCEGPRGVFLLPASQQMYIIRPRMTTQRRPRVSSR
jgi:hypothetical protein